MPSKRRKKPTKKPAQRELTAKQQRFVAEYLVDLNATQAAIRAGYSAKTAESQASRLLRNVKVLELVEAGKAQQLKKAEITAERVIAELGRIAFSDVRQLFDQRKLREPATLDDDTAAAISSIEVVTKNLGDGEVEYVHKVRLWDKTAGLGMLAKHLGVLKERVELTGKDGTPIETRHIPIDLTKLTDEQLELLEQIGLFATAKPPQDAPARP